MKIVSVEPLHCDAGWAVWTFVKLRLDDGTVGYGECSDWRLPRAIAGAVRDLAHLLIGKDPRAIEALSADMARVTQQNIGGVAQQAIAGIEVALWDLKGKLLGVPVYELLGGPTRDRMRVYWSHCGSSRARHPEHLDTSPIESWDDVAELGREVVARGYSALKTNIFAPGRGPEYLTIPDANLDRETRDAAVTLIATFREAVGDDVDICLDLNFRFRPQGCIELARALEPFGLCWLEVDTYDADALAYIRRSVQTPICSAECLNTVRDYLRFFERGALDVAMVDVAWNGLAQSKRIADLAAGFEINVAPHNYYSHLSTFMCAHLCAVIDNLRILETDVDAVPWRDEIVTALPDIRAGFLHLPTAPGLGTDLNEAAIAEHPWPG